MIRNNINYVLPKPHKAHYKYRFGEISLICFISFFIVGFLLILGRKADRLTTYLLLSSLFSLLVLQPIRKIIRREFDPFEAVNIFIFVYLIYFFVYPLIVAFDKSYSEIETLNIATFYAIIGLVSFYAGYFSHIGNALSKILPIYGNKWYKSRVKIITALFFIGLICYFVIIYPVDPMSIILNMGKYRLVVRGKSILLWGMSLIWHSAFIYSCYNIAKNRKINPFILLFFLLILFAVSLGARWGYFSFVASVITFYNYTVKRIKLMNLFFAGVIILLLLFFTAIIREDISNIAIIQRQYLLPMIISYVHADIGPLERLMTLIKGMPYEMNYQYGYTYLSILLYPIPRIIWKEKPDAPGVIFGKTFYPDIYYGGTTYGLSILGESYANFHVFGIIIGMFLLGVYCKTLYSYLKSNLNNKVATLIYAATLPFIPLAVKGGYWDLVPNVSMALITLFISLKYISSKPV